MIVPTCSPARAASQIARLEAVDDLKSSDWTGRFFIISSTLCSTTTSERLSASSSSTVIAGMNVAFWVFLGVRGVQPVLILHVDHRSCTKTPH